MPCGPNCVTIGADPPVECLAVVDPARFAFFRDWCHSGDETKRKHVLARSRIGVEPEAVAAASPPGPVAGAPPSGPSLVARAVNLGKAIVTHVAAGMPEVDEETFASRLGTCHACPHYRAETKTCGICGCGELKLRWASQVCPIGKW